MARKSNIDRKMRELLTGGLKEPWWLRRLSSAVSKVPPVMSMAKERSKNAVLSGINLLPELAGLIRNNEDLVNYENMSADLINKASRHTETASYVPFISGVAGNLREDYDMYTKTMESGAKFIDDPNFITDMQGWDDLENTVANMTLEDGKTPKYQGNGTSLFLTEQNNAINSLISRIQNSSKGTQFRYNKAGNKYTDAEMIKNLEDYQGRLGVALQASFGDGIITKEEAESIMLGDLPAYQTRKRTALKRIGSHYDKLDAYQKKLINDIRDIQLKPAGFDFSGLLRDVEIENSLIIGKEDRYDDDSPIEGLNIDTSLSSTGKEDIIKQMQDQIATINLLKQGYKKSHVAWSGESFRPKVTVSKEEKDKLLGNIMTPKITGITDPGQVQATVDVTKIDLDEKIPWGYGDPKSYREAHKEGGMSDSPDSPLYAIDGVYQYPELFKKEKKKVTSKIYDQKPSKTDIDEKKYSNKRPDLFPTLKRSNGKFVFVDGENLKEWDNKAYHNELKKEVPILNAGYDNYYWDNGWKHMKGGSPLGTATMSPSEYKKIITENKDLSKKQREVFLKDVGKGLKWIKKNLLKTGEVPSEGTIIGIE